MKINRRPFSILETVLGFTLFLMLATAIAGGVSAAQRARQHASRQARAILALENVVARIPAQASWTSAQLEALLGEESARAAIPQRDGLQSRIAVHAEHVELRLESARGRLLASVRIPSVPSETTKEVAP